MNVERLHRLIRALGSGPHSASLNQPDHVRRILMAMGDTDTARLVTPPPSRKRPKRG